MSQALTLWFEPLDVLIFRDLRGLDPGEQHDARTGLPGPAVMLGALRGALFRLLGADFNARDPYYGLTDPAWRAWLGSRQDPGTLQLRGPLLYWTQQGQRVPLFPAPLDLDWPQRADLDSLALRPGSLSSLPRHLPWRSGDGTKDNDSAGWLCLDDALQWLQGGPSALSRGSSIRESQILAREVRVGIGRGHQKTASETLYYQQETLRFRPGAGLAVEVDADPRQTALLASLDGTALPLGGRGHHVTVRVERREILPRLALRGDRARAWFISPMLLRDPSLGLSGPVQQCRVLGTAAPIGGWDLAKRQPRPLNAALPAGSVVELEGVADLAALRHHTWGQPQALARAGYGSALLGGP